MAILRNGDDKVSADTGINEVVWLYEKRNRQAKLSSTMSRMRVRFL
jgi:hypothetical protein